MMIVLLQQQYLHSVNDTYDGQISGVGNARNKVLFFKFRPKLKI